MFNKAVFCISYETDDQCGFIEKHTIVDDKVMIGMTEEQAAVCWTLASDGYQELALYKETAHGYFEFRSCRALFKTGDPNLYLVCDRIRRIICA